MACDPKKRDCDRHRDELLRLGVGDTVPPSAGLASHLAECGQCRAALDSNKDLLRSLAVALVPEPLSEECCGRIIVRLGRPAADVVRRRWRLWNVAAAGIAASLLVGVLYPWGGGRTVSEIAVSATGLDLSKHEAAEIVAAYALLGWEAPADYALPRLAENVECVARSMPGGGSSATVLPWSAEDNWDVPVTVSDGGRSEHTRPVSLSSGVVCSGTWPGA